MKFTIDPKFHAHLRKLTKAERTRLEAKIEHEGCADGALVVARIDGDLLLIDGHNTVEICEAKGIKLCEPRVIDLPTRDAALEWMEENQQSRRNASQEEMEKAREKRTARAAEARQEGKSLRQIAEDEGVSQTQIKRDLDAHTEKTKSGVTPVTPEPETPKVQGKDGKSYPATKAPSAFCSRCQRVGPVKDCQACAALKSSGKPSSNGRSKAPKPGSVKYDWNVSDKQFGAVARWPDAVAAAYPGEKKSTEYKRIIDLLTELAEVRKDWHKRLKKIKES